MLRVDRLGRGPVPSLPMCFFDVGCRLLALSSALAFASCATYEEDLMRGQHAFEQSEHERALAILRALEPDTQRLSVIGRAHYAYLRGMTDYRIGYRSEARHWLSVASTIDEESPGSLPADWEKRMSESLKELNEEVYAGGIQSLWGPAPATGNGAGSDDADALPEPASSGVGTPP
jgi:hypothetical protein